MKTKTRSEIIVVDERTARPIVPVPAERKEIVSISTVRLLILAMSALFWMSFSGVAVGHVLSYLIPLILAVLAASEIYRRWGIWHSIWVTSLGIFVFATGFGSLYMNHMLSLFTSIQKISLGGLLVSIVLLIMTLKGK